MKDVNADDYSPIQPLDIWLFAIVMDPRINFSSVRHVKPTLVTRCSYPKTERSQTPEANIELCSSYQNGDSEDTTLHESGSPTSPLQAPSAPSYRTHESEAISLPQNASGETNGVGTLVVNSDGRSKFIGQSASYQWLRDETNENQETRSASPALTRLSLSDGFPFQGNSLVDFPTLWSHLPPNEEAMYLVGCFNRHIAWVGSPILEEDLLAVVRWLYSLAGVTPSQPSMASQLLALVFIVLALGSFLNTEVSSEDPACMEFYRLAQQCLVLGNFLVHNSLTTVQTLSLMSKFSAYAGMRDVAWQIRGMANRIMLAIGLHRDGKSWNLSTKDLNNRRRTFWENYSTDVLISSNWDRPSGLNADMFDTSFPDDYNEGTGFEKLRCRLATLAQEALHEGLKVCSSYENLKQIWRKTLQLEAEIPFHLRNRAALSLMVSRYSTLAEVEANTPPPSRNLRLVFQSHDLIDVASTLILSMFRPYFVHATQESDPTTSIYGEAYLAVIERSSMLIANLRSLHSTFPLVSTRHWFYWNHAFSGAVSMATICMANPGGPLVDQALNELNSIISLYTSIQPTVPSKWAKRNLQWLLEVRARAYEKINAVRSGQVAESISPASMSEETTEHLLLVGWRKRLVELDHKAPQQEPEGPQSNSSTGLDFDMSDAEMPITLCTE
ncbi:hypothetical protein N7456_002245 [Penicillium angulare]|uniref:Xylanolytic transcriptional activator regulatory domain-containing protein n=1 Tax=Penicillium angulare TaxID=116970 RepID=A0A9W9G7T2_9EURO|nr:hypothetical protein N7456_002245 [Penicillium angulare]